MVDVFQKYARFNTQFKTQVYILSGPYVTYYKKPFSKNPNFDIQLRLFH